MGYWLERKPLPFRAGVVHDNGPNWDGYDRLHDEEPDYWDWFAEMQEREKEDTAAIASVIKEAEAEAEAMAAAKRKEESDRIAARQQRQDADGKERRRQEYERLKKEFGQGE